jgi:nickel/cobalt exporter
MSEPHLTQDLWLLTLSASGIGFFHSITPAHWIPVVLMSKTRKWSIPSTLGGALVVGLTHTLLTLAIAWIAVQMRLHEILSFEHEIERFGGWVLLSSGVAFAALAIVSHARCRGHEHHGPHPNGRKPVFFLFLAGLNPCIAVLPIFFALAPHGYAALTLGSVTFTAGVLAAILGASTLVRAGLAKLDHPFLEHYGDAITGVGIALVGTYLLFLAGAHAH